MARTVRVRLELDRADYKQGLRDAANDTRTFDGEVQTLGGHATKTGVELKGVDAAAKQLGDDVKKSSREVDGLGTSTKKVGDESTKTSTKIKDLDGRLRDAKTSVKALADEYVKTGDVDVFAKLRSGANDVAVLEKYKTQVESLVNKLEQDASKASAGGGLLGKIFGLGGKTFDNSEIPSLLGKEGSLGGTAFGEGFIGTLKPFAGPAALAFGLPLVAELGALLGGATLGAVGLGAIGAGLALQFSNPQVKASITDLGSYMKGQLTGATSSFADQFVIGFAALRREIAPLWADLSRGFHSLDPYVSNLLARLGEGLAKLGPGLSRAMEAAGPIIGAIAKNLPTLFNGIGVFFDEISKGGKGAAEAIDVLIKGISMFFAATGFAIRGLSDSFDFLVQMSDKVTGVLAGMWDAAAKIPGIGAAVKPVAEAFDAMHASVHGSAVAFTESQLAADGTTAAADHTGAAFWATASAAMGVASSVGAMNQKFDDFMGKTLSVDQANLASKQTLFDLAGAVKQYGTSLDQGSEKGLKLSGVVLGMVDTYKQQRQAAIDAAGGTNASKEAVARANGVYDQNIQNLLGMASTLHMSRQAVLDLIGPMYSIPNITRTITINEVVNTAHKDIYLGNSSAYQQSASTLLGPRATGGFRSYAAGGVDYKARSGILKPSDPGTILAGEPQTGGEAFIPRKGISDARGLALANTAAGWHGGQVVAAGRGHGGNTGGYVDNRTVTYAIYDATDPRKVVAAIKDYERDNGKAWRDR